MGMGWRTAAGRCTSIPEREAVVKLPTRRNMSPIHGIDNKKQFRLHDPRSCRLIAGDEKLLLDELSRSHQTPCAFKELNYTHTSRTVKYALRFSVRRCNCLPSVFVMKIETVYRRRKLMSRGINVLCIECVERTTRPDNVESVQTLSQ